MIFRRFWRRLQTQRSVSTLPSLVAYAQWAQNYPPHAHNLLMQIEESVMLDLLPELAGRVVLDLACGTGRYALLAHERGAGRVIGLDNSAAMLQASPVATLAQASVDALPLSTTSIDVVVCGLALGHVPQLDAPLCEISRILKTGGVALVSDFHPFIFLNGRQRTFSANGQTFAVEHYAHLYSDYSQAAHRAGLVIEEVVEPRLGSARTPDDDLATDTPVVIVYRLAKNY